MQSFCYSGHFFNFHFPIKINENAQKLTDFGKISLRQKNINLNLNEKIHECYEMANSFLKTILCWPILSHGLWQ
jgi:hypothetical protein